MRDKKIIMTNALDNYWGDKRDTKKWKKTWVRTKLTMELNATPTPKLQYSDKLGKIILGYPKEK